MVDIWQQKQREARAALVVGAALLVCPDPVPAEAGHANGCRECGEVTEHVARWNGKAATLCPACARAIRVL